MNTGSKDLISSLPDELLCHILSFLSTKDAALTSILSRRWRFLLASVPNLDFDCSIYDHPYMGRTEGLHLRKSFKLFVDRVIALQGNARLNKFSLKCKIGSDPSPVNRWILNVLERCVVELDLHFASEIYVIDSEFNYYPLPPKVLMSKNLVKLKLVGTDDITFDAREVFLPKLKTLHINYGMFDEQSGAAIAKIISGCHVLEELVMTKVWVFWESFYVSNPNLKRLTFFCNYTDEYPDSRSFNTPNLVYLEFIDNVAAEYLKMNFDSLVEASICLRMTPDQIESGSDYSPEFFMGIRNVKILCISSNTLEVCELVLFFLLSYHVFSLVICNN